VTGDGHRLATTGRALQSGRSTLALPLDRLRGGRARILRLDGCNIPEFRLRAFDGDDPAPKLSMKVVVGSVLRRTKTPVVHGHMRWVVFRPYWDVPATIAHKEILPRAARDPAYLAHEQMEFAADGRLRQRPGPRNALGLVKFVFPNPYDVYLHDTPQKEYFARSRRDLSHGCMRVADAVALAEFVLGWDRARITTAMTEGANNRWVALPETVPVYVLYTTVAVEDGGSCSSTTSTDTTRRWHMRSTAATLIRGAGWWADG
jgi:murein L,D-transpeptidase YcbB/YkuD